MLLRVPDAIGQTLWEGQLELDDSAENSRRAVFAESPPDLAQAVRELPIVSIGAPEVWRLAEVYEPGTLSPAMRSKLAEADFYLVRLSCSFRPVPGRTRIEWARFAVSLRPGPAGNVALAYDLHPLLVTREVKRNLTVTLSPTLKFLEVEAGLGKVDFGVEYAEVQPVISASGAGETEPAWDYSAVTGARVHGSKWMHLLVKGRRGATRGEASLHLTADVVRDGFRIPVFSRPSQASTDPLTVRLWG